MKCSLFHENCGIGAFAGLDPGMLRWLDYEQTVNERLLHPEIYMPIGHRIPSRLRPEARSVWDQEVVWLPEEMVRRYGPVAKELHSAFGLQRSRGTPLFLHPQPPAAHTRLSRIHGKQSLGEIVATPTSSYRSVVAWDRAGRRSPVLLKLSLGAIIGRIRRAFREDQIARAVVISSLFDTIPIADRDRLKLDWFSEPAGMAETHSEHGWLLRRPPRCLSRSTTKSLIPVCSLISRRGEEEPLLVTLIRQAGKDPVKFIVEQLLRPYVNALSYLLFEQGLQCEAHSQNVLFEVNTRDGAIGRIVLRDLSDTTVNIAFRVARGKILPAYPKEFFPAHPPFSMAANAADFRSNFDRSFIFRGYDTVERYGLWGFVWPINTSMGRYFKGFNSQSVERSYLELWQQAAIEHLGVRPMFREKPIGLATDEAIAHWLGQVDWRGLGAVPGALPDSAEALLLDGRMRRKPSAAYQRLECAWGDLFISGGLPGFLRAAI